MATTRKRSKHSMPLLIEDHAADYDGFPFVTLIQFRQEHLLTIVDNADDKLVKAYVLDGCGQARIDVQRILPVCEEWFKNSNEIYPLSIEFSKQGLSDIVAPIYHTFNVEYISRVIGPFPRFNLMDIQSTKRRRRKTISRGVSIHSNNVIDLT